MEAELETTTDFPRPATSDRIKITLEDLHTKNSVTAFVDNYSEDTESLNRTSHAAFNKAYETLMEGNVYIVEKSEDQDQDLKHQKPEESDNLQKSESPDADYMKDRNLDRETHGTTK